MNTRCGRTGFLLLMLLLSITARAATPRWTTGPPYFTVSGTTVVWYTNTPSYYTDPGDLSASVNHAAADAIVAAAAGVWNVPTSMMQLQQGGLLNEPVSSANTYLGSNGLVFPADVQSSNYAAKQIAVIYDRDGSVTDLLLGGGASDPSSCLQNGVTESVDGIIPAGQIQHAVLILNGRCTGPAPEKQLQMQYQLERAFGRVLGLGWSQLNDNVFMGTPQPTYDQAMHWPVMHPIDIICGPYTYQCMLQPFTLRDDDIASISFLYPVTSGNVPPGKQPVLTQAATLQGNLRFPVHEGISGVNIVVRRNLLPEQVYENFDEVSTVTGVFAQQLAGNAITPKPSGLAGSFGEMPPYYDVAGYFDLAYIPVAPNHPAQDIILRTEAVNPLYTGEYSIAPYPLSTVTPSGQVLGWRFNYVTPQWNVYWEPPVTGAAINCTSTADGTERSPISVPPTGWWTSLICGVTNNPSLWSFAHTSWLSMPVSAHRSFTVEMTALDESGYATGNKVRPVIGVWNASDALGSRPSLASAAVAFNSVVQGMSTATAQVAQAGAVRLALSSETGDGRPDYNYQARVLYADSISPASATAGTQITISGVGFRPGNTVTVNGVAASVASWTANTIVATVPRLPTVLPGTTATADITVTDLSTHGATTMSAAFQYIYTAPTYILQLVSAPAPTQIVDLQASPAFAVRVIDEDGVTPLVGTPVLFSILSGTGAWGSCGASTCMVLTDSTGLASITITPQAAETFTLQASGAGQTQQVSFVAAPLVRAASITPQYKYLAAGAVASWTTVATFTQQGQPAPQQPVVWASTSGNLVISAAQTATTSAGTAQASIQGGPLAAGGQATGTVCAWGNICATFTAFGVDLNDLRVISTGNGAQSIAAPASFVPATFQVTDTGGNPVAGATVQIHQTTRPWTAPCGDKGRCAVAPVVQATDTNILSDSNGNVSVTPLDMGGPEVTAIVVASGNQGYASVSVQRHP